MDTPTFILKRAEIQQRMSGRRMAVVSDRSNRPASSLLPWALRTGMGLVSGLATTPKSYGWLGSMAGAVVLPTVLKFFNRKNPRKDGLLHKLARIAFPSLEL